MNDNDMEVKDLLKRLFDCWGNKNTQLMIDDLVKSTGNTNVQGTFKTQMWTSMYNDLLDIPVSMSYLITGLKVNSSEGFELIDFKVDED